MKVLISKYEVRARSGLRGLPDYVEVASVLPPVFDMTEEQRTRLTLAIETAMSKTKQRKKSTANASRRLRSFVP